MDDNIADEVGAGSMLLRRPRALDLFARNYSGKRPETWYARRFGSKSSAGW